MMPRTARLLAGLLLALPALAVGAAMPDDPYATGSGAWGQAHAD